MCLGAESQMLRHDDERGFADKSSEALISLICELGGNAFPYLDYDHLLRRHHVPCGLFMGYPKLLHHQPVVKNDLMVELDMPYGPFAVSGLPWRFSLPPCELHSPSDPGQYTQAVIRSTGRDPATIPDGMDERPKLVDAAAMSPRPF